MGGWAPPGLRLAPGRAADFAAPGGVKRFDVSEALASGALVAFELDHPPLDLGGLHVLFAPDRRLPLKVRAMIDYLVEVFENSPCRPS